ncbi:uncharacterized protein SCHCODRAFT_02557894 [Schizophyllum commune H4-8]|nr:uncharacterized protein SCHCODRAFT_02527584 [Schizophyllum commune H4-8]XP_050197179.1 uncharacterized protein SCHCODRAFT_02557894 [Schizophyllum commune H4-8]KAI5885459.1 hypothetical protein SCHCODRAFT_02557894 [Schizophyllum commune H4-8]KAI5898982.1 hypothetical protein SCHCODRAFT_02527584 [Schizophyllum commune H4-8]
MAGLFWRQFAILCWKNAVVLSKHPLLNILRAFILPIAYGIFLAVAQSFLVKTNNYGIGEPHPIFPLSSQFDGSLTLVWADATNGSASPSPTDIMSRVTSNFSPSQLDAVKKVASPDDIPATCPENFNLFSECFAAIEFHDPIPTNISASVVNYTLRADVRRVR